MEFDERYYRRRVAEEQAAAERAVTLAARMRRQQLAELFSQRLQELSSRTPTHQPQQSPKSAAGSDWDSW